MGMFRIMESHGKRSSSMTFALRWKHETLRLIVLSAIISIAMTFMFLVLLYGTADKSVSVVVNGQEQVISTKQLVLQRLLDEQAITVGPHDKVSMPLDAAVKDGDRIIIEHALPITVKVDGKETTFYTTEKTVGAAVEQADIALRAQDKIYPALDTRLSANLDVTVVRVEKETSTTQHTVPFEIIEKEDPNLEQGKQKVIQSGKEGRLVKKYEKVYEDGVLVDTLLVTKYTEAEEQHQIVAVGTKKPEPAVTVLTSKSPSVMTLTKSGVKFDAKKVLKSVTLTAYSAGFASTGKTEDHPQYGITSSGAKVQEGRTIAVDPKVIPIGWWVYIEGIGFRRAEDTGSAIKGNKIDVYYDSHSQATKFGRKKGYTVYVIGPNKPTAS